MHITKHNVGDLVCWDNSEYGEEGTDIGYVSSRFSAGNESFYRVNWSSGAGSETVYSEGNISELKSTLKKLMRKNK